MRPVGVESPVTVTLEEKMAETVLRLARLDRLRADAARESVPTSHDHNEDEESLAIAS